MKRPRFTAAQIASVLKETATGLRVKEVCYRHGISESTYYNWKSKYGGLEAENVRRLKELEDENLRLKKSYAELRLEHAAIKDLMEKFDLDTAEKREVVSKLRRRGMTATRACELVKLGRASVYRETSDWRTRDAEVIDALNSQLRESPNAGFWKCFQRIREKGYEFNHKRVYRVYCQMGLNLAERNSFFS